MSVKYYEDSHTTIYQGDCRNMTELPDESVQVVVTSPPYFGLRKYSGEQDLVWGGEPDCEHTWQLKQTKNPLDRGGKGQFDGNAIGTNMGIGITMLPVESSFCSKCQAWRGQLGLEPTVEMYIDHLVEICREIRRVLRSDGVFFLNIGDSYAGSGGANENKKRGGVVENPNRRPQSAVLKPKDLCLIPFRLAIALQSDSWWVRSVIIWNKCLSGNTPIYALSNGAPLRTTIRELYRLRNRELKLPSPDGWQRIINFEKLGKRQVLRIVLRNGFWITATPEHRFPTNRGLLAANALQKGDVIDEVALTSPCWNYSKLTTYDFGLFIGWFLAEGSYEKNGSLRFSMSASERDVAEKLGSWASEQWGASWRIHNTGGSIALVITSQVAVGAVKEFLYEKGAKQKHLARSVWNTNPEFLEGILDGWLAGDIGFDGRNNRYYGAFSYNRELNEDMRLLCSLLGYSYRSRLEWVKASGKRHLAYRVEIRRGRSNHHNNKPNTEIVEIGFLPAPQDVYEITVEGNHLFTLPDGSVTHNSNPMPESVKDRPTESHEYILMLTKSARYYWDQEVVREPQSPLTFERFPYGGSVAPTVKGKNDASHSRLDKTKHEAILPAGRNLRSVWTINTQPYPGAHFATFPEKLVEICVKAATPEVGCCSKCGASWERVIEKKPATMNIRVRDAKRGVATAEEGYKASREEISKYGKEEMGWSRTIGWQPICDCKNASRVPSLILDPFLGSGTTAWVAKKMGRRCVGYEISREYCDLAVERCRQQVLF